MVAVDVPLLFCPNSDSAVTAGLQPPSPHDTVSLILMLCHRFLRPPHSPSNALV